MVFAGVALLAMIASFQNCSGGSGGPSGAPASSEQSQAGAASTSALSLGSIPSPLLLYVSASYPFAPSGGASPYTFSVNQGCISTIDSSLGVFQAGTSAETCTVTVTDADAATVTATVDVIAEPVTAPAVTYSWQQSGFGACSAACGGGVQTQTVTCVSSAGVVMVSSNCSGTQPVAAVSCNPQACIGTWVQTRQFSGPAGEPSGYGFCNALHIGSVAGQSCSGIGAQCTQIQASIAGMDVYALFTCQ
jgi:hypothetical protein